MLTHHLPAPPAAAPPPLPPPDLLGGASTSSSCLFATLGSSLNLSSIDTASASFSGSPVEPLPQVAVMYVFSPSYTRSFITLLRLPWVSASMNAGAL